MEQTKAAANAAGTNVTEDDGVLYRARPHPLALLWPLVLLAAVAALAHLASHHVAGIGAKLGFRGDQAASLESVCAWLLVAVIAVFVMNVIATALECVVTSYVVLPTRVVAATKLLRSSSATVYLARVEAVVRDQGPIERLFDVGSVTLVGTGGDRNTLTNVKKFSRFMAAIDRLIPARHGAE